MHIVYDKVQNSQTLKEFVQEHKISDKDLDYLYIKIVCKDNLTNRLIRSEADTLLFSFELNNEIIEIYQLIKTGKFFRIAVPDSIINYINLIRLGG